MQYIESRIERIMSFLDKNLKTEDNSLREVAKNELIELVIIAKEHSMQDVATKERENIRLLQAKKT